MCEDIRVYLMERREVSRQKAARLEDGVLPNINKKIAKESFTNNWLVMYEY